MADGGKGKRKLIRHTACFDTLENATLLTKVDVSGVSVSAFLRTAALEFSQTRAVRRPTVNHRLAVQLLAEVGRLTTAFDQAADSLAGTDPALIESTMRDVTEMRLVLLEAMGRAP